MPVDAPSKPGLMGTLKKKGPLGLPLGVWLIGGGAAAYFLYQWYANRSATSGAGTTSGVGSSGGGKGGGLGPGTGGGTGTNPGPVLPPIGGGSGAYTCPEGFVGHYDSAGNLNCDQAPGTIPPGPLPGCPSGYKMMAGGRCVPITGKACPPNYHLNLLGVCVKNTGAGSPPSTGRKCKIGYHMNTQGVCVRNESNPANQTSSAVPHGNVYPTTPLAAGGRGPHRSLRARSPNQFSTARGTHGRGA